MAQVKGDAGSSSPLVPDLKSGVWGQSDIGYGVAGTSSLGVGVGGLCRGVQGVGIFGSAGIYRASTILNSAGIFGVNSFGGGYGVLGESTNGIGTAGISTNESGVYGRSDKEGSYLNNIPGGIGVKGENNLEAGNGVLGQAGGEGGTGVFGHVGGLVAIGVKGIADGDSSRGVYGQAYGFLSRGVEGRGSLYGVYGKSDLFGVYGESEGGTGVQGISNDGAGVSGFSLNVGVFAYNNTTFNDAYLASRCCAGDFYGNVAVHGQLQLYIPGQAFKIDHPFDPANKYLSHSFVQSPDMKNVYDGVAVIDAEGKAVVKLPDWFEALNENFCYQLTSIGTAGPNLHIAEKINNNCFTIAGGVQGMEVSWQVTGTRKDVAANAHRIRVEEEKPEHERGYYLHPHLYDEPEEKGIKWARYPEQIKMLEDERERLKDISEHEKKE